MATHSSVLAWRIPGTGEPGGLPSMGLHRVRHDWSDLAAAADIVYFTLSGDRYFSITKHNFEFFSGSCLKLFQIIGSFQILLLEFVRWSWNSVYLILGYSPLLLLNQNHSLYFNWYPLNYEAFPLWMMSLFISLWEVKALFPIIFWGIILVLWPGEFFICVYWLAVSWILWWIFLQNSAVSIPYSSILSSILFGKFFSVVLPQLIFLTSGKLAWVSLSPISLPEHSLRKKAEQW